jgi:hypothetical protein
MVADYVGDVGWSTSPNVELPVIIHQCTCSPRLAGVAAQSWGCTSSTTLYHLSAVQTDYMVIPSARHAPPLPIENRDSCSGVKLVFNIPPEAVNVKTLTGNPWPLHVEVKSCPRRQGERRGRGVRGRKGLKRGRNLNPKQHYRQKRGRNPSQPRPQPNRREHRPPKPTLLSLSGLSSRTARKHKARRRRRVRVGEGEYWKGTVALN